MPDIIDEIMGINRQLRALRVGLAEEDVEVLHLMDYVDTGWIDPSLGGQPPMLIRFGRVVCGAHALQWEPTITPADSSVSHAGAAYQYDALNVISASGAGNLVGINSPKVRLAGSGKPLPEQFCPTGGQVLLLSSTERNNGDTQVNGCLWKTFIDSSGFWTGWDSDGSWTPGPPVDGRRGDSHLNWPSSADSDTQASLNLEGICYVTGAVDTEIAS